MMKKEGASGDSLLLFFRGGLSSACVFLSCAFLRMRRSTLVSLSILPLLLRLLLSLFISPSLHVTADAGQLPWRRIRRENSIESSTANCWNSLTPSSRPAGEISGVSYKPVFPPSSLSSAYPSLSNLPSRAFSLRSPSKFSPSTTAFFSSPVGKKGLPPSASSRSSLSSLLRRSNPLSSTSSIPRCSSLLSSSEFCCSTSHLGLSFPLIRKRRFRERGCISRKRLFSLSSLSFGACSPLYRSVNGTRKLSFLTSYTSVASCCPPCQSFLLSSSSSSSSRSSLFSSFKSCPATTAWRPSRCHATAHSSPSFASCSPEKFPGIIPSSPPARPPHSVLLADHPTASPEPFSPFFFFSSQCPIPRHHGGRQFSPSSSCSSSLYSSSASFSSSFPSVTFSATSSPPPAYDVCIVGAGHAGIEAALAAARAGASTLLITQSVDTLGRLSCNPSIGGVGKSCLVREVDAFDGAIGRWADLAAIHWRVLNASRGPATWGTRAQIDREVYVHLVQEELRARVEREEFHLAEGQVTGLLLETPLSSSKEDEDHQGIKTEAPRALSPRSINHTASEILHRTIASRDSFSEYDQEAEASQGGHPSLLHEEENRDGTYEGKSRSEKHDLYPRHSGYHFSNASPPCSQKRNSRLERKRDRGRCVVGVLFKPRQRRPFPSQRGGEGRGEEEEIYYQDRRTRSLVGQEAEKDEVVAIPSRTVVIAAGTFLAGKCSTGLDFSLNAGRLATPPCSSGSDDGLITETSKERRESDEGQMERGREQQNERGHEERGISFRRRARDNDGDHHLRLTWRVLRQEETLQKEKECGRRNDGKRWSPSTSLQRGPRDSFLIGKRKERSTGVEEEKGEHASNHLAESLAQLDLPMGRFKTGTPARLYKDSIDYSRVEEQPSDPFPSPFSFLHSSTQLRSRGRHISCYRTYTNERTHALVQKHLEELPKHSTGEGQRGLGPRYCPSIAAKVLRFPDRPRHVVWLEPEGLHSPLIYPNGLSGAFPVSIQLSILRSIPGLENVEMHCPAYEVEYAYVHPTALDISLQVKSVKRLFLAGQVIGTTGYEEAAALGLLAGWNAALQALKLRGKGHKMSLLQQSERDRHQQEERTVLTREGGEEEKQKPRELFGQGIRQGGGEEDRKTRNKRYEGRKPNDKDSVYVRSLEVEGDDRRGERQAKEEEESGARLSPLPQSIALSRERFLMGVLAHDLTQIGVKEPYRMFPSRAECRLSTRPDNADFRCIDTAVRGGLIRDAVRTRQVELRKAKVDFLLHLLRSYRLRSSQWDNLIRLFLEASSYTSPVSSSASLPPLSSSSSSSHAHLHSVSSPSSSSLSTHHDPSSSSSSDPPISISPKSDFSRPSHPSLQQQPPSMMSSRAEAWAAIAPVLEQVLQRLGGSDRLWSAAEILATLPCNMLTPLDSSSRQIEASSLLARSTETDGSSGGKATSPRTIQSPASPPSDSNVDRLSFCKERCSSFSKESTSSEDSRLMTREDRSPLVSFSHKEGEELGQRTNPGRLPGEGISSSSTEVSPLVNQREEMKEPVCSSLRQDGEIPVTTSLLPSSLAVRGLAEGMSTSKVEEAGIKSKPRELETSTACTFESSQSHHRLSLSNIENVKKAAFVRRFLGSSEGGHLISDVKHPLQLVLCLLYVNERGIEECGSGPYTLNKSTLRRDTILWQSKALSETCPSTFATKDSRRNAVGNEAGRERMQEENNSAEVGELDTEKKAYGIQSEAKLSGSRLGAAEVNSFPAPTFSALANDVYKGSLCLTPLINRNERGAENASSSRYTDSEVRTGIEGEATAQPQVSSVHGESNEEEQGKRQDEMLSRRHGDCSNDEDRHANTHDRASKTLNEDRLVSNQESYENAETRKAPAAERGEGICSGAEMRKENASALSFTEVLRSWLRWENQLEDIAVTVGAECRYGAYFEGQEKEAALRRGTVDARIPSHVEYTRRNFPSFSTEELEQLEAHRPQTLREASRIPGVSPATLLSLYRFAWLARRQRRDTEPPPSLPP